MIPILNQPDPSAPLDAERLNGEFAAGLAAFLEVPLSQAHLACLALAAQHAVAGPDCGPFIRAQLQDFILWCAKHADFGPETRKLLAQQAAALRKSVRTPGPAAASPRPQETSSPAAAAAAPVAQGGEGESPEDRV